MERAAARLRDLLTAMWKPSAPMGGDAAGAPLVPEPPALPRAEAEPVCSPSCKLPSFAPGLWDSPPSRLAALGPAPSLLVVKPIMRGFRHRAAGDPAAPRSLSRLAPDTAVRALHVRFRRHDRPLRCGPRLRLLSGAGPSARCRADAALAAALLALDLPPADIAIDLRHADDSRALFAALPVRFCVGFAGAGARHALDLALPEMEASARAGGLLAPLPAGVRLSALAEVLASAFRAVHGQGAPIPLGAPPALPDFPGGYVLLAPGARLAIKLWPMENWRGTGASGCWRRRFPASCSPARQRKSCSVPPSATLDRARRIAWSTWREGRISPALQPSFKGTGRGGAGFRPAHLVAALGRPTLCLFSGLADIHSACRPARGSAERPCWCCAPCFLNDVADCTHGHGCMTRLTPDHALALAALGLEFAGVPAALERP